MNSKERLIKALDYLKEQNPKLTNPTISKALNYNADNYVADILSGAKPINALFLKRLKLEYSINPEWISKGLGNMLVFENETKGKEPTSQNDLMNVLLERIAALTKTQNLILEQNQVQIVGGIKELKADVLLNRTETAARASAIKGQIEELGRNIHQDFQKFSQGVPLKQQGKTPGKSDQKRGKQGNHVG